jgi:small subunit ribosomal protein S1
MSNDPRSDEYKQKFRPDQTALDQEVDAALAGVSMDDLYGFDKPKVGAAAEAAAGEQGAGGEHKPAGHIPQKGFRLGKIISIGKDDAFIDFGGKSQGVVSLVQFLDREPPQVGEELEFHVERYDEREGLLICSRKGATASSVSWETLEIGQVIEGTVTGMNKGGLEVDVKGMRAFMPSGQVDLYFQKDISVFIGQRIKAEVTQFDAHAKNLVISRRNVLEREKEEAKTKLLAEISEGQMRRGTVRSVTDFGAFVEVEEGVEGLLPVSEMSWQRIRHPNDVVKDGDTVRLVVISMDPAQRKISFSLKQAGPDPWKDVKDRYAIDMVVDGKVTRVVDFGAFIELEPGLEGLVHISELDNKRVRASSDVVKPGQDVKVRVLEIDPEARRMSLSIRRAAEGAAPVTTAAPAAAVEPAKKPKQRKTPLKGGLDWNW